MDTLMFGLESMNLDSSNYNGGSLKELLKLVYPFTDGVSKPARKADIIKLLHAFYSDSESAQRLYDRLSKYEKALLCCTVQSNYKPLREDFAELAKAHKFEPEKQRNYYYYSSSSMSKSTYYPKNGLLGAFYVNGSIPPVFKAYLNAITPPYVRNFVPCEVDEDEYAAIIGRENRYKDFDALVRFVNNQNVPATKAGGYMSKSALLKFYSVAGLTDGDEMLVPDVYDIKDIRNAGDTTVCFAIAQLLRCADVLDIIKDKYTCSGNAVMFSKLSVPEKAKFLFDAYINHKGDIIAECFRISSSKLKFSRSKHNLSSARREKI